MLLGFEEGILGELGRIYHILGNHVPGNGKDGAFSEEEKILMDTSIKPEERARMLVTKAKAR